MRICWNGKKLLLEIFLSYQKRISPMDVFIILQLSCEKLKQIRYFDIINIAECLCEIGCISEGSVINQSWSKQVPVAAFSQMALLGPWTTCYVSVKVGHM